MYNFLMGSHYVVIANIQYMVEGIAKLKFLIIKHLREGLSPSEQDELQRWIDYSEENRVLFSQLTDPDKLRKNMQEFQEARTSIWNKIDLRIGEEMARQPADTSHAVLPAHTSYPPVPADTPHTLRSTRRIWAYAAAAGLLFLSTGVYFWQFRSSQSAKSANIAGNLHDIPPGGNKASLTLANGSVILLEKAVNGHLAEQGTSSIVKDSNLLAYTTSTPATGRLSNTNDQTQFNTLTTPRSGQFQLLLPDGSKVWLNNASSLRYPAAFTGDERIVELSGEAYFEVAPFRRLSASALPPIPGDGHGSIPFKVLVDDPAQKKRVLVEVLGTHFNIMAYPDEEAIRTTLLEGKIRVSRSGQQIVLNQGEQLSIGKANDWQLARGVDTEDVVDWKNGFFHFDHAPLADVMRQLARWYDVDIEYEGKARSQVYQGEIKRDLTLSQILENLGGKDIHFRIEGKKVVISTIF